MEYKDEHTKIESGKDYHPCTWCCKQAVCLIDEECAHCNDCKAISPEFLAEESNNKDRIYGAMDKEVENGKRRDLRMGEAHHLGDPKRKDVMRIFEQLSLSEHDNDTCKCMGAKNPQECCTENIKYSKDAFSDNARFKDIIYALFDGARLLHTEIIPHEHMLF